MSYPIDKAYLFRHTKVDLADGNLGVGICAKCGHQFIHPSPSKELLSLFYQSYMSNAKNGFYQARRGEEIPEVFRDYYGPWILRIKDIVGGKSPKLLDVGCGLGMFLRLAQEKGFQVNGIEPNAEAVSWLEKTHSIKAYNILLEDFSEEGQYDVVTMWDLLEHLANPVQAVEKVHSMLATGGVLVLEIPVRDSFLHWAAKGLYKLSFGKLQRPLFLVYGFHHLQYFSEESVISLLEDKGFDLVCAERAETNLDALRKQGGVESLIYNWALQGMFAMARAVRKQNKLVIIARKSG